MAGQAMPPPGGGAGGTQVPPPPPQVQSHGGQVLPGAQAGHAHAQPPPPEPPPPPPAWHTPERHGWPCWQGMPRAYQTQALPVSAVQAVSSTCALHASVVVPASGAGPPLQSQGGQEAPAGHDGQVQLLVVGVPSPVEPPLETVPEPTQPQLQGGQVWPGAHSGQAQAQVPSSTQPPSAGSPQSQSQGAHVSPGRHEGHAQVQVPPPPLPPPAQSHSIGGQVVPAGQ